MVIKQLVLKINYFFSNSVLLKILIKQNCVDRYAYHIDYAKNINNVNP